ncbi:MAG TPA: flagellar motor protein MotB [Micropepsaceae bacterium]|nr:flagellar motor protein MotB [Micropepsaceae bacterium]
MAADGTVVIKRVKKGGHGGHHGGAWKVAYADFVTAMMAFFLLMWLINTTTPEQKRGIADYFAAQNISKSTSGAGGVLSGKVFGNDGARAGGAMSAINKMTPPKPKEETLSKTAGQAKGGSTDAQGTASQSQEKSDDKMERQMPSEEHRLFEQAMISLRQAMQQMPDIAELSQNIMMTETPEGLNIQLVDEAGQAMFQPGTANLYPKARILLQQVAKIVDRLPNRIAITGHTDAAKFVGAGGLTNWELSAARANAARAVLAAEGIDSDRIFQVSGKAGSDPLLPDDPYASANRRIGILLMSEAPVIPPGHKL